MKPDAPAEYRGIFSTKTNVPGMEVCELLPLHAKCADKYTLIRSVSHEFADHGGGHKRFLTGYKPKEPAGFVNDNPMAGSVVSKLREHVKRGLPNYIAEVDGGRQGVDTFSFGSAYLGSTTTPFFVAGDPGVEGFKVENLGIAPGMADPLDDRARLLGGGMRTGQVVGATNSRGEYPTERPLKPEDWWATVYRHLGIDWTGSFLDHSGRPMPILPGGEPIAEILPGMPA